LQHEEKKEGLAKVRRPKRKEGGWLPPANLRRKQKSVQSSLLWERGKDEGGMRKIALFVVGEKKRNKGGKRRSNYSSIADKEREGK